MAYNHIHHIKKLFHDGGAIYNLSASADTFIAENYIHDIPGRIALYLDEGSRHVTLRNNVIDGAGTWLNVNTFNDYWPLRATTDNLAMNNWHSPGKLTGSWNAFYNNRLDGNREVKDDRWPDAARRIIENAGLQPSAGEVLYRRSE